ncbi:AAA family ATPase [Acidobacteriota bacterium]
MASKSKSAVASFRKVRSNDFGSRFYKADLHFHTPASTDATGKNKYNFAPHKITFPAIRSNDPDYGKEVRRIQDEITAESKKIAKKMIHKMREQKVSLVAVTDHNGLGPLYRDHTTPDRKVMNKDAMTWYELLSDTADEFNNEQGRVLLSVIPGVEISTAGVHILALFEPTYPKKDIKYKINGLLEDLGFSIEQWGIVREIGNTGVYRTVQLIHEKGGLPIIAHIDGSDRRLLGLHAIESNSMRVEIGNKYLPGVEIVDTKTLKKKIGKTTIYGKFDETRRKKGLESLAYFQGSDAHCIRDIAKRYSYIKMSRSSYKGLMDALSSPSSRILLKDQHSALESGFFLYGVDLDYGHFKETVRFNRHINCVVGRRESGKSTFLDCIRLPLKQEALSKKGYINLFFEKIIDRKSHYYSLGISTSQKEPYFCKIDKARREGSELNLQYFNRLGPGLEFFNLAHITALIEEPEAIERFIEKRFGSLGSKSGRNSFNEKFTLADFLGEREVQLLRAEDKNGQVKFYLDVNFGTGKENLVEFTKLGLSRKTVALLAAIILGHNNIPIIIDDVDSNLDNADIADCLVPIMKRYKKGLQLIFSSSNSLLAVNADPENYIMLERKNSRTIQISSGFSIDKKGEEEKKDALIRIIDGSRWEIKRRYDRYGVGP